MANNVRDTAGRAVSGPAAQTKTDGSWRGSGASAPPSIDITIPIAPFSIPLRGTFRDGEKAAPDQKPPQPHVIPPEKSTYPFGTQYASDMAVTVASLVPKTPHEIATEVTVPLPPQSVPAEKAHRPVDPEKNGDTQPPRLEESGNAVGDAAAGTLDDRIIRRFRARLSPDLYDHFDLFLYVSKAEQGPIAQRMYVLRKTRARRGRPSRLVLLHDWPVSTGRETIEYSLDGQRMSTTTPEGFYELDPDRLFRRYKSVQWGLQMPHSMFFNWIDRGRKTGLAIHGVLGEREINALGSRFSAGCVHLAPDDAKLLYDLVLANYRGPVPRFAYDPVTRSTSNEGKLDRDRRGRLRMNQGYRVLVYVENFGGNDPIFSELEVDANGVKS